MHYTESLSGDAPKPQTRVFNKSSKFQELVSDPKKLVPAMVNLAFVRLSLKVIQGVATPSVTSFSGSFPSPPGNAQKFQQQAGMQQLQQSGSAQKLQQPAAMQQLQLERATQQFQQKPTQPVQSQQKPTQPVQGQQRISGGAAQTLTPRAVRSREYSLIPGTCHREPFCKFSKFG